MLALFLGSHSPLAVSDFYPHAPIIIINSSRKIYDLFAKNVNSCSHPPHSRQDRNARLQNA